MRQRSAEGFALRDVEDAASFLAQMGLLLQTPHPYLPSLFGAAQGKPARPGVAGFGQWPEHAWSWAGELAERADVLLTKVLLGKRTLVHRQLWPCLDAAVRGRRAEGPDAMAITAVLEREQAVRTDELRVLAKLDGSARRKRYEKAMSQLEAQGVVLCRPVLVANHKHVGSAELWTVRFPRPLSDARGVGAFVLAAVKAAGAVPTRDVPKWFAWPRSETGRAIEELVATGELRSLGDTVVPATDAEKE